MILIKGFRVKVYFSYRGRKIEYTLFFKKNPSYKDKKEALELKLAQYTEAFPDEKFDVTIKDFENDSSYKELYVNNELVHSVQSPDFMFDN